MMHRPVDISPPRPWRQIGRLNAQGPCPRRVYFERINAAALVHLPAVCRRLFPAGRVEGREFVVGNLNGDAGRSLKINLDKGCWRDFAADIGGSDPVSLVAAVEGVNQAEAARLLTDMLNLGVFGG